VNLRSYLRVLRERWKLVLFFLVASVGVAVVVTAESPKEYTATAQVYVVPLSSLNTGAQQYTGAAAGALLATIEAPLVTSDVVMAAVRDDLHVQLSNSQIRGKVTATAPPAQSFINIAVTDRSPDQAAAFANSVANKFASIIVKETSDNNNNPTVKLLPSQSAKAPSSPTSPNPILNIGIGFFLGLLIGAALAVARDVVDNRIKDPDELSKVAGAPMMGIVVEDPKTPRHPIATRAGNRNVRAENYRQLRANLQFANVDHHPRVIAVTSSVPTEGKTTVAINLASTLAEAGFSVCLVDADLRRPTVAKVLGLLSPVGLTSVLIHQIELGEVLQHAGSSMYVLTSGPTPPNPSEVLASSYVRDVIRSLLDKVDYVVIDTAPLLPVADGSEVAALADGTLLVARHGLTTDNNVKRAVATLARVDAKLLGVVLNRMPLKRNRNEYGYTYYRETDAPTHSRSERRKAKKA
jgi:capsular exopolysaccharide synthesis family protein